MQCSRHDFNNFPPLDNYHTITIMKQVAFPFLLSLCSFLYTASPVTAQQDSTAVVPRTALTDSNSQQPQRITISVLAPFYLDSLYNFGSYKFSNSIPRFALSGLEFYNGVQMAADWLEAEGLPVDIQIIDTRRNNSFAQALASPQLKASQMMIAMVQSPAELRAMAAQSVQLNIPLISATYPNDGNVVATPNLVILNSTLGTHCQSIYSYLQTHHSLDNLILLSRKSNAGDFIKNHLMEIHADTRGTPLDWKEIMMADEEDPAKLIPLLDSTRQNTIIVSSLNETFAKTLVKKLSAVQKTYPINVFGMPTWDGYKLTGSEYKGVNIYYTTPFADAIGNAEMYKAVQKQYMIRANSDPSDMALRGFEATYRFAKTLLHHPEIMAFLSAINDSDAKVFSAYDFKAIPSENGQIRYYENKHLYMVHHIDGIRKSLK